MINIINEVLPSFNPKIKKMMGDFLKLHDLNDKVGSTVNSLMLVKKLIEEVIDLELYLYEGYNDIEPKSVKVSYTIDQIFELKSAGVDVVTQIDSTVINEFFNTIVDEMKMSNSRILVTNGQFLTFKESYNRENLMIREAECTCKVMNIKELRKLKLKEISN